MKILQFTVVFGLNQFEVSLQVHRLIKAASYPSRRYACINGIGLHIFCYQRTGADNTSFADRNPTHNRSAITDPHIILDNGIMPMPFQL